MRNVQPETSGRRARRGLRPRLLIAGIAALIAAVFLAFGASESGKRVRFDTVSDLLEGQFNALTVATSEVVFDESKVHTYSLSVTPSDWNWLNDNPLLEEYVPAALEFQGRTYENVAIRYKGFFGNLRFCFDEKGNRTCEKLSLKLKFSEYDSSGRFFGLQRLNFHSMEADPTKMHDALGYGLFREAGVPAPRTAYARVLVNGELFGLFAVVEQIDEEFIRNAFPDAGQGTLYKEIWPEHLSIEPYAAAVVTGPADEAEAMVRFAQAVQSAGDDEFVDVLESWTELPTFVRYLAADRLMDNFDGIVAWYCPPNQSCFNHNYFWYEEAFSDRVWLIPWDLDHIFEYPSPIRTYYRMPDWNGSSSCKKIPVFFGIQGRPPACDRFIRQLGTLLWDDYAAASHELLDGPFATDRIEARIDTLEDLLRDAVAEDPTSLSVAQWEDAVEGLREAAASIRTDIERKIE